MFAILVLITFQRKVKYEFRVKFFKSHSRGSDFYQIFRSTLDMRTRWGLGPVLGFSGAHSALRLKSVPKKRCDVHLWKGL